MSLSGCKVVIIGASSPIGHAIARAVIRDGGTLALAGRSAERLDAIKDELHGAVTCCEVDVRDERGIGYCLEQFAPFDHLVITAAQHRPMSFLDLDLDAAREMFEVKFWGQLSAAQEAVCYLNAGGSITFFSGHAEKPGVGGSIEDAINGAVDALVVSLAQELHPIRINAVSPGDHSPEAVADLTLTLLADKGCTGLVARPEARYHTI